MNVAAVSAAATLAGVLLDIPQLAGVGASMLALGLALAAIAAAAPAPGGLTVYLRGVQGFVTAVLEDSGLATAPLAACPTGRGALVVAGYLEDPCLASPGVGARGGRPYVAVPVPYEPPEGLEDLQSRLEAALAGPEPLAARVEVSRQGEGSLEVRVHGARGELVASRINPLSALLLSVAAATLGSTVSLERDDYSGGVYVAVLVVGGAGRG